MNAARVSEARIVRRIAMWSGPRNLSTALLRSFSARNDCAVWDEPYYAAYLAASGIDHPMRSEILAAHETEPQRIAQRVLGPVPHGRSVFYQKHMAHHMLPAFDLSWVDHVTNVILIRAPEFVLASYAQKRAQVSLDDLGYPQLLGLFDQVQKLHGRVPAVVDAADITTAPEQTLRALCTHIGIAYQPAMIAWPPGRRSEDGIWERHWYGAVRRSDGLKPSPTPPKPKLDADLARIAALAQPLYAQVAAHRLRAF